MRDGAPSTIYLKNYQPFAFEIETIVLDVELSPSQTRVKSTLQIKRKPGAAANAALKLDGKQMKLARVAVDRFDLRRSEYELDDESLILSDLPDHCTVEIETLIDPEANTALEGLYLSNGMFCRININFADFQLVTKIFRKFIQHGSNHPARAAPFCPVVYQHRCSAIEHFGFEGIVSYVND